jgi:hypothetical protein
MGDDKSRQQEEQQDSDVRQMCVAAAAQIDRVTNANDLRGRRPHQI